MGLFIKRDNVPPELQKVYVDFYWSQSKLWELDLAPSEMAIEELEWIFDYPIWYQDACRYPRRLLEDLSVDENHRKRLEAADLGFPLHILKWKGQYLVLDGVHRLLKHKLEGRRKVRVKELKNTDIEKIFPDETDFESGFLRGQLESRYTFLRKTFDLAEEAVRCGDHPFGSLLVLDGKIIKEAKNTVNTDNDVTRHAELNLVSKLGKYSQEDLKRSVLYASTEPCAMCTGAIAWSGIRHVVFGCSALRLKEIAKSNFMVESREILKHLDEDCIVEGPLLLEAASEIHRRYW